MKKVYTIQDLLPFKKGDTLNIDQNALVTPAAQDLADSVGIVIQRGGIQENPEDGLIPEDRLSQVREMVKERLGAKAADPAILEKNVKNVLERLGQRKLEQDASPREDDPVPHPRSQNIGSTGPVAGPAQPVAPERIIISMSCKSSQGVLGDFLSTLLAMDLDIETIDHRTVVDFVFVNIIVRSRTQHSSIELIQNRIRAWAAPRAAKIMIHEENDFRTT